MRADKMISTLAPNVSNFLEKMESPPIGLAKLPTELLYIITDLLKPDDIYHCRLLSCSYFQGFTAPPLLRRTLIGHYPKAREVRHLLAIDTPEIDDAWTTTFDKVVARYAALKAAHPRSVINLKLLSRGLAGPDETFKGQLVSRQHPIAHWDRYYQLLLLRSLSIPSPERSTCEPRERFWTCDDSGLLIYLDPRHQSFVLYDLNSKETTKSLVRFPCHGRIVRRIRLRAGLLIIEWAEGEPYHQLNDTEAVHRHFVTAFDVKSAPHEGANPPRTAYKTEIRNEWKLHFLGFPLKSQDLWLSAHTNIHYAAYIWQPNRSAWGEDEPIESLSIWDISQSSDYRPSMDPFGSATHLKWPQMIKKISYTGLDHWTVRQRDMPVLRRLELDAGMVYFCEGRATNESGAHAGHHPTDRRCTWFRTSQEGSWTRKIGIPIIGFGPPWESFSKSPLPGDLHQVLEDNVAGIRYDMISQHNARLFLKHDDDDDDDHWHSSLNLEDYGCSPEISIYADEHRIVMQCGEENLKVLRFDYRPVVGGFAVLDQSLAAVKSLRPSPLSL